MFIIKVHILELNHDMMPNRFIDSKIVLLVNNISVGREV